MENHSQTFGNTLIGQTVSYFMLIISLAEVEASLRVAALLLSIAASIYTINKNKK
jgi:hypothetical protein